LGTTNRGVLRTMAPPAASERGPRHEAGYRFKAVRDVYGGANTWTN
jgi:hypothetical protein